MALLLRITSRAASQIEGAEKWGSMPFRVELDCALNCLGLLDKRRSRAREITEATAFYKERASIAVARAFLSEFVRAACLIDENPGPRHSRRERASNISAASLPAQR